MHTYSHLYPCPDINGTFTNTWCCDAHEEGDPSATGCCDNRIHVVDFGNVLGAAGLLQSPQTSSSTKTSSAPTTLATSYPSVSPAPPQPSASQNPSPNKAIAVGAGVGVPLGVLLVATFAYLWYRERKSRRQAEQQLSNVHSSLVPHQSSMTPSETSRGYDHGVQIQELDYLQRQPELHFQHLAEVADHSRGSEISTK